jgi:hypothetical protein
MERRIQMRFGQLTKEKLTSNDSQLQVILDLDRALTAASLDGCGFISSLEARVEKRRI